MDENNRPMKKKKATTINDIANYLGIAKSTVSNVFTKKKYVSEEIRQKVLKACEEMDYYPSFIASTLVTKRTNIIGIFFELNAKYQDYYSDLIRASMETAADKGFQVLLYYNNYAENVSKMLVKGKAPIDGAILVSPQRLDPRIKNFSKVNIPFIVVGHLSNKETLRNLYFDQVDTDNKLLTYQVTGKLIEMGHEKIAFLNSKSALTITEDRQLGYKECLKRNKIKVDDTIIFHTGSTEEEGYKIGAQLMENRLDVTAFITANDLLSAGIYRAAVEKGLSIGGDLSVIALGGSVYTNSKLNPPLSHAKQNYHKMAEIATSRLIERITVEKQLESKIFIESSELIITNSISKRR